jgi:hypothetical protein
VTSGRVAVGVDARAGEIALEADAVDVVDADEAQRVLEIGRVEVVPEGVTDAGAQTAPV